MSERVFMATAIARLPDAQLDVAAKRNTTILGGVIFVALVLVAGWLGDRKFIENVWRFPNYIWNTIPVLRLSNFSADLAEWYWGIWRWTRQLVETLLIAYLGTLLGAAGAFALCFLASANLVQSRTIVFVTRRFLEFCRTVPELVFALIFVIAFGLGPLPGVLAIMIHTAGALGKLFAEVVENIDMKPVDGVTATGATWTESVRFAVLPQVLSGFISYTLLRFGIVGAGGIGLHLSEQIRTLEWQHVSFIVLLILAAVATIDYISGKLRFAIIGRRAVV